MSIVLHMKACYSSLTLLTVRLPHILRQPGDEAMREGNSSLKGDRNNAIFLFKKGGIGGLWKIVFNCPIKC